MLKDVPLLRSEAQPARFDQLDQDQKAAFSRIVRCLADATTENGNGPQPHNSSRHSRTFFLDGGRGSGKTTTLLTVRAETESANSEARVVDPTLIELRRRLVWLEPLDLEAFPSDGNIFNAVLARLEQASGSKSFANDRPRGLLETNGEHHDMMLEVQRLALDVAVGWEGNLGHRRGHLDPNTYAIEVQRAEHARIDLPARFARLVEHLASLSSPGSPKLFVLPIDDADLGPVACRNFLRTIRALLAPHLFIVVLGELDSFIEVLTLGLTADLAKVAHPASLDRKEFETRCTDRATELMRKYFPPAQRTRLSYLSPSDLINFVPFDLAEDEPESLGALIARTDQNVGAEVVGVPLWSTGFEPRSGAKFIHLRPRQAADLWYQLVDPDTRAAALSIMLKLAGSPDDVPQPFVRAGGFGTSQRFPVLERNRSVVVYEMEIHAVSSNVDDAAWPFRRASSVDVLQLEPSLLVIETANQSEVSPSIVYVPNYVVAEKIAGFWNATLRHALSDGLEEPTRLRVIIDAWISVVLYAASTWTDSPLDAAPTDASTATTFTTIFYRLFVAEKMHATSSLRQLRRLCVELSQFSARASAIATIEPDPPDDPGAAPANENPPHGKRSKGRANEEK
jgi:hypothetical protein